MNDLLEHTQRLTQKLQLMQRQLDGLVKEQSKLRSLVEQREQELATAKEQCLAMQAQKAVLGSGANPMPLAERKAFERKINLYIKDIDKAILQLLA
jgi:hypothetical protein